MNKEINKLINREIKESNDYIDILNKRIEFYKQKLEFLNQNEPYFFQKKEIKRYKSKLKEYNEKIEMAYTLIGKEEEIIMTMEKNIDFQ